MENNTYMGSKPAPLKSFKAGAVQATIWKNSANTQNKGIMEFNTVSFERSYKDKDGNWKTTHTLRLNDLPKASLVLKKAYEFLAMNTT